MQSELNVWTKFRLHYLSTMNTKFNLKWRQLNSRRLGVYVACDCLINEVKQVYEQAAK